MKKTLIGAAAVALGVTGALAFVTAASAATGTPVESACNTGWYVNTDDETDRAPKQVEDGLKFSGDDLVHHAVSGLSVTGLTPGTFVLAVGSAAPDQPSFFSVEVTGEGTGTYGTLRWNTDTSKWNMVANGGQFYEDEVPAKVVAAAGKGTSVFSFGVGYTKNPPGTVPTTVKSITFAGETYTLSCPAKPANEHVAGEKWECATGYSTRGGTVEYTWDEATHAWVKKAPVWGDWVKQRDLTDEESKTLECPTTPPADGDNGNESPSATPTPTPTPTPSDVVAPVPSESESTESQNAGLPVTGPGGGTNVPLIGALAGTALLALGAALFVWARRRNTVAFTA